MEKKASLSSEVLLMSEGRKLSPKQIVHSQGNDMDSRQLMLTSPRKSTLQNFSKEVFILKVEIVDYYELNDHITYIVKIKGKTKYLVNLAALQQLGFIDDNGLDSSHCQVFEFNITKRYSELYVFNKILQSEMKNYMRKKGYQNEDYPDFPPKRLFNRSKNFVQKRITKINQYFQELFTRFPQKIPFTNSMIDLCQPFKLNAAVIGAKGSGKTQLIQSIVDILVDYKRLREELKQTTQSTITSNKDFIQDKPNFQSEITTIGPSSIETKTFDQLSLVKQKSYSGSNQIQSNLRKVMHSDSDDKPTALMNNLALQEKRQVRYQSRDPQRVKRLVFTHAQRENSQDPYDCCHNELQSASEGTTTKLIFKNSAPKNLQQKKIDSYFPLDIPFQMSKGLNYLFRLDIQEYQVEEHELRFLLTHIIHSEEKNALIFTFDLTNQNSFKIYLKKAIKELIFAYEELSDDSKQRKTIPFLIIATKADQQQNAKVSQNEIMKLMDILKKNVRCEIRYASVNSIDDTSNIIKCLFGLSAEILFNRMK